MPCHPGNRMAHKAAHPSRTPLHPGRLVSHIQPARNPDLVKALAAKKATVVGMDVSSS